MDSLFGAILLGVIGIGYLVAIYYMFKSKEYRKEVFGTYLDAMMLPLLLAFFALLKFVGHIWAIIFLVLGAIGFIVRLVVGRRGA